MQEGVREEIALIGTQRAALLGLLGTFAESMWDAPTACAPWRARDVTAHLVDGELALGRIYRGEVREYGYQDPDEGIKRWSALPGPAVAASLWQHGTATQRVLEAMPAEQWHAPIKAFGCNQIGRLVRLHLFELAMHGRDLSDAAGAPAHWHDALPFLVTFVVRAAPKTLNRLKVPPHGALRIEDWTIDGRGDAWTLTTDPAPATVKIDQEELVLAVTGRMDPDAVTATFEGDEQMGRDILRAWQVVKQ